MSYKRHKILDLNTTNYYHCITRCVRRSFLCGMDDVTKKDYDYRKLIIRDLLKLLSKAFAIEICSYSIMCNHVHLVFYVNKSKANSFTIADILQRWSMVYPVAANDLQNLILHGKDEAMVQVEQCRRKLFNISFFMEKFCVTLARQFNKEDNCKGRFWEGRFQSIPILDLQSLINTMIYVDLNPIRANMVSYPEEHEYSSISERFYRIKRQINIANNKKNKVSKELLNSLPQEECLFKLGRLKINNETAIFSMHEYLKYIDIFSSSFSKNNKPTLNIFERLLS